jgi:hypothetical protein
MSSSARSVFDLPVCSTPWTSLTLVSFWLVATATRMLMARSASVTESVPVALFLRPENGSWSGPRWHCELMLMRVTWCARKSIRSGRSADCVVKMAACWPNCVPSR